MDHLLYYSNVFGGEAEDGASEENPVSECLKSRHGLQAWADHGDGAHGAEGAAQHHVKPRPAPACAANAPCVSHSEEEKFLRMGNFSRPVLQCISIENGLS